jgi:hypothetical protein
MEASQAQTAHDWHLVEIEQLTKEMITKALEEYNQEIQLDIQTTLNGHPTTFSGMIEGLKKDIVRKLQKAFK